MTDSTPKKKRRILLKATIAIVLFIAILIALLPTILSMGLVRGIARDAIAGSVNGEVDLAAVKLGWLSDQRVEGLSFRDKDGSNTVDVTLTLRGGLLGLVFSGGTGGADGLDLVVSGSIVGTRSADGTLGLESLFKSGDGSAGSGGGGGTGSGSGSGGAAPKATITIDTLSVAIKDLESQKRYAIDGLKGAATFDGGGANGAGTLTAKLNSATDTSGLKGSIDITIDAKGVAQPVNLAKLIVDAKVNATNLRVPAGDREAEFRAIELTLSSPGLAQSARVVAKVEGTLEGTASTLAADIAVDALVNSAGAVAFKPANVRGTIDASNLPTSLLEPWLASTNVRLSEDLGAVVERLSVKIPGGGAPVALELKAPKATLAASAVVDPESGAVNNATFDGTIDVTPASLARLASAEVSAPVRLALRGRSLAFAASGREDAPALERLTGWVEVQPETPVVWLDRAKNIAAAAGPSTVLRFGRDDAASRFAAQVNAALALGSATEPPSAPSSSNLSLGATVDAGFTRVENATLTADLPLEPGFLVATTGQSFSKPVRLRPTVRDLDCSIPAGGAAFGLGGIAIDADVRVEGETALYVAQVNRDIALRDIALLLKSEDLTGEIALALDGVVDTATVAVRQTVRSLPSDPSAIDPFAVNTRGTTKLTGLSAASLIAWVPQQRTLIESAGIRDLSIDLANEPLPGKPGQRVTLALGGEPMRGNVIAGVEKEQASIDRLELSGTIARALVLELQGSSEQPVTLAADAPFTLALARPTSFRFDELAAGGLPAGLAAQLTLPSLVVASAPGLAGPVTLQGLDTTVEVDPSATKATAKGSFAASGAASGERIEAVTFDLAWAKPAATDPPSLLSGASGSMRIAGVQVPWVEGLVGLAPGTVSNWTGDAGSLALTMARSGAEEVVTLEPSFPPNITEGRVTVRASGERVTATAAGLRIAVPPTTLERISTKPNQAKDAPRFQFASGLSLALTDATVELPKALVREGDTLAGGSMQVALAIEPMTLRSVRPGMPLETLRVPALQASLRSTDLRQAVTFDIAQNEQTADGSTVRVQGGLSNLSDASGAFSADAATLDLDAEVKDLPTAIVDLLAATDGSLGRALGDRISMTAKAKGLSAKSGQANLEVRAPFVELKVPQLTINSGGVARITEKNPLTATFALSPGIKDDLLYQINTIFADVELVKERATLTVRDLRFPLDGNLARFDSDLTLDVGDVRMRNGKPVSLLFQLLDNRPTPGSEARIEPLLVKVNNGRLTYDNFALRLFKQEGAAGAPPTWRSSIEMKGDVDLAKKRVNAITTRLPLSQVANYSGDATKILNQIGGRDSDLAKSLSLGVTLSGPLYDEKGNFKELEMKLAPPEVKPEDLLKEGLRQLPGLVK